MKTNGNDPANPVVISSAFVASGLTKREHFAMAAMQGYVSELTDGVSKQALAEWSVGMADALIDALNKEVSNG